MRPIGAVSEVPVNVRIVSATHKDLGAEVQAGRFRQDLYYRLNVIQHPRAAAARARSTTWPPICDARARAHRARCRRVAGADADARGAAPPGALCLPGQRARAREPAAPRAWRCPAARSSTWHDLGLAESSVRGAGGRGAGRSAARQPLRDRRRLGAARWRRGAAAERPRRPTSTRWSATSSMRALERHRYNRTAAGASLGLSLRQMRYRMARLGVDRRATASGERGDPRLARAWRRRAGGAARSALRVAELRRRGRRHADRPGGAAFDQPAAGRVRRRRDRATLHQPPRLGCASLLRTASAACRCRRTSWSGATASCCSSCPATSAPGMPAARAGAGARTATTTRSASSSKGSRARPSSRRSTRRWRGCCVRWRARYPIDEVVGHEHVAPGRKSDPGAGFDWPRLRAAACGSVAAAALPRAGAAPSREGPQAQRYR